MAIKVISTTDSDADDLERIHKEVSTNGHCTIHALQQKVCQFGTMLTMWPTVRARPSARHPPMPCLLPTSRITVTWMLVLVSSTAWRPKPPSSRHSRTAPSLHPPKHHPSPPQSAHSQLLGPSSQAVWLALTCLLLPPQIQFLADCDHPNVVRYLGSFRQPDSLWIVMEHCGGGSVGDLLQVCVLTVGSAGG